MSLRSNIIISVAGNVLAGGVAFAAAPLLYRYFGAESFGLIGLYLLLQGMIPILDGGISLGFARAVARGGSG